MNFEAILNSMSLTKAAVVGMAIAGFYYMAAYDDGTGIEKDTQRFKSETAQLRGELLKMQAAISSARGLDEKVEGLNQTLKGITLYMPRDSNEYSLMKLLSSEAKAAGVNIVGIRQAALRSTTETSPYWKEFPVDVELKGSFSQMLLFLSFLTRVNRMITVESFDFGGVNSGEAGTDDLLLNFKARFYGYRYLEPSSRAKKGV